MNRRIFLLLLLVLLPVCLLAAEIPTETINITGASHIDLSWKWTYVEGQLVTWQTFASVLRLMDLYDQQPEPNPVYYAQSSAQAYQWIEQQHPALFQRIRDRVHEGRWEIVGGMWCESDAEQPSGESFVRQFLTGQWYFYDKFGVMAEIGWLPDSFGFNANLPQFHARAGIDKFFFYKLNWNDTNPPKHNLMWWIGPDGSKILSHLAYAQYNNRVSARAINHAVNTKREHEPDQDSVFFPIGTGNHGGGIVANNITRILALQEDGYHVRFGRVADYFASIDREAVKTVVRNDEMYFESHRGTYTSRAEHKKNMRELEYKLQAAETFSSLAYLFGREYPWLDFDEAWKRLLRDQFHDVMSGTALDIVYKVEVANNLAEVRRIGDAALAGALDDLAGRVDTSAATMGEVFHIFNPNAFASSEPVVLPGIAADRHIVDENGAAVSCQYSPAEGGLVFVATNVPAWGWRTYQLASGAPAGATAYPASATGLENDHLKVELDASGYVTSIYNKDLAFEFVPPGERANLLQLYKDGPVHFDAWDLGFDKYHDQPAIVEDVQSVQVTENGPVRQVIEIARQGVEETYLQRVILYADADSVDFETLVGDWGHPAHRFLKVAFPTTLVNARQTIRHNVPYGSIPRVLDGHRADTEFVGHKWVDLTATYTNNAPAEAGLTLFNREKFGYDVANDGPGEGLSNGACNILRLSLLKSAWSPLWLLPDLGGPVTDQGDFLTHYRVYPHPGDTTPAELYRRGEAFANPLLIRPGSVHHGELPATGQLLWFDSEGGELLPTTLKRPDRMAQDHELILRLVEIDGQQATGGLERAFWSLVTARRADLLERVDGDNLVRGDGFKLTANSGAIETVRLTLGEPGEADDDGGDDTSDDNQDDDVAGDDDDDDNDDEGCCG